MTKEKLNQFKEYRHESYDEVINKMVSIIRHVKTNPKLSKEAVLSIEKARERIKHGDYITEQEAKDKLGIS